MLCVGVWPKNKPPSKLNLIKSFRYGKYFKICSWKIWRMTQMLRNKYYSVGRETICLSTVWNNYTLQKPKDNTTTVTKTFWATKMIVQGEKYGCAFRVSQKLWDVVVRSLCVLTSNLYVYLPPIFMHTYLRSGSWYEF